ncbi:hypothetical protein PHJA_002996800 [Phtheirospermum japonicum]|uniref:S-protein homolog n=1 Tax=Phtheirospermum japonicum TaxID=374723 RepID=A0A830D7L0_9LAMI|nr:hypothetical protein PHJA_002996800 [Phtheirospermum japonicum]
MLVKTTVIYLTLSLLLSTNLFHRAHSCFFYPRIHVGFFNQLPKRPHKPLYVHCKSKDDDLGIKTLMPGQYWEFTFCEKYLATLFRCDLHWKGLNLNNLVGLQCQMVFYTM